MGHEMMGQESLPRRIGVVVAACLFAILSVTRADAQVGFSLPDENTPTKQLPSASQCGGRDLIEDLKSTDPTLHEKIVSEAETVANDDAILWRVEKPGVAPSHLFGTIHLTDARITTLSPAIHSALGESRTVLLEVADITPNGAASAMLEARHLAFFADGRRLNELVGADDYAQLEGLLMRAGIPPTFAPMMRPWLVTLMLASSECERAAAEKGQPVLDMAIANAAKARGLEIEGLETVKSQLEAMANIPESQQIEMLKAAVRSAPQINDYLETMVRLYLDRRIGATWPLQIAMAARHGIEASAFDGFKSDIVSKRNHGMHEAAGPYVAKGGAFIAVGALHLVGDDGLVALLRRDGFTVSAVE
ncbi:MAG: TraB/GumN family protein [Hyphomicrobium sp.]|nr:TraB/GumN family protein [Hyphomicrobium sp.]